jgi:hypothetical protein
MAKATRVNSNSHPEKKGKSKVKNRSNIKNEKKKK